MMTVCFRGPGVLEVSVTAEAVASPVFCNNEVVSVPARGRMDRVQRPLIVKVGHRMGGGPDGGVLCSTDLCVSLFRRRDWRWSRLTPGCSALKVQWAL